MKRWIMLLTVASLLIGSQAFAQCNNGPDEICIVWDFPGAGCQNCTQFYGGVISAYVVLQNASTPAGILGFEFMLRNQGGAPFLPPPLDFVLAYIIPYYSINVLTPPEFAVGLSIPLPWSPAIQLVEIQMLILDYTCWCFGVAPLSTPSIPGSMVFADGADPGHLLPMYPCTGQEWDSSFMTCINCEFCPPGPPIATENMTFGGVKAIYR
jgi:hypothetical protein